MLTLTTVVAVTEDCFNLTMPQEALQLRLRNRLLLQALPSKTSSWTATEELCI